MAPPPKPPSDAATTSNTNQTNADDDNNTITNNIIEAHGINVVNSSYSSTAFDSIPDAALLFISMNSTTSTAYQCNDASSTVQDTNHTPK
eukprot:14122274-Ditylum_brightwellii.AAC.1